MISHSPLRHIHLFRFRLRFIVITALISSFGSAVVGLLAPYHYTSTATIQVETKQKQSQMSFGDEGVEFHKAALLIESPQILTKVAEKLVSKPLDTRYYFPRAISAFDFPARVSLLLRHMGYQPPATSQSGHSYFTAEVVTSLLAQHVQVTPDYRIHTIAISYEAGSPDVARTICSLIVDAFVELSNAMEKDELRRQEKYLLDSIDRQLASIRHLEQSMQAIVEEHPSMTSAQREQGRGATLAAQRLLDKKERLAKIEQELGSNGRVLAAIEHDLTSANTLKADITSDVSSKLIEEISTLEFRRLQSIKVTGYPENHPSVVSITRRINDLKRALGNLDRGRVPASRSGSGNQTLDIKNLYAQAGDLRAKSRVLVAERDLLLKEMAGEGALFKEAVKINFRFDSLVRELTSDSAVTNELYRELQRIRITLAGATPTSAVLSPANFNPHAVNLSVRRRTIFGLFVGIAFAMSLLILYEIVRPTLLQADDLEYIKLSHMGTFTNSPRSLSQLGYCIRSLEPPEGKKEGGPQVISFLPFASSLDVSEFVAGMAGALSDKGAKVGAVLILDPDAPTTAEQESLWADASIGVQPLSRDEVPFFLVPTVEDLKKKWDFILIVEAKQGTVPIETYLARCSDHFIYVTQVGDTDLTSVDRVRHLPQLPSTVRHHSIIVHVPIGANNSVLQGWKRRGDRAA